MNVQKYIDEMKAITEDLESILEEAKADGSDPEMITTLEEMLEQNRGIIAEMESVK